MSKKLLAGLSAFASLSTSAALKTQTVEYTESGTVLEGYLVYDDSLKGKVPGIVVVHDWMGNGEFAKGRAQALAKLGYVAFAADIYGKGVRPADAKAAGTLADRYKTDRPLFRRRLRAAHEELLKQSRVDAAKTAAIGYCFGGTGALELARSGAPVAGVVSFHGGLGSPTPNDAKAIRGKVLVLHGADDPFVPAEEVSGFEKEMREAQIDWQLIKYGASVHSFSNPKAGSDNSKGAAYNEKADKRSWLAMQSFLQELFR